MRVCNKTIENSCCQLRHLKAGAIFKLGNNTYIKGHHSESSMQTAWNVEDYYATSISSAIRPDKVYPNACLALQGCKDHQDA